MDFLGLRNLTIIDDAVKNIEINHGIKLDLLGLELTDKARTSCWPGATRSACSSSTAARCARCCA